MTVDTQQHQRLQEGHDDADCWIPLEQEAQNHQGQTTTTCSASATDSSSNAPTATRASLPPRDKDSKRAVGTSKNTIPRQEEKAQDQQHAIHEICFRFLFYLVREMILWDYLFRNVPSTLQMVGLGLLAVGTGVSIMTWFTRTWFVVVLHPVFLSMLILVLTGMASTQRRRQVLLDCCSSMMFKTRDTLVSRLTAWDPYQVVRWSLLCLLFVIPTLLEMKMLSILWKLQRQRDTRWCVYTFVAVGTWMVFQHKVQHWTPRKCTLTGMLVFHACITMSVRPWTTVSFISLLGSILLLLSLWKRQDCSYSWISARAIRQALRLSLRNVLARLEKSTPEEMLQLLMMRWIVDYWSTSNTDAPAAASPTTKVASSSAGSGSSVGLEGHHCNDKVPTSGSCTACGHGQVARRSTTSRSNVSQSQHGSTHELEWSDLLPMLDMTTAQMGNEILHDTTSEQQQDSPLGGLKRMLLSMNVDQHAKPAVLTYKRAVENFPPSRHFAEAISIASKSPCTLLVLCHVGSPTIDTTWPCLLVLLPFIAMEFVRLQVWINACYASSACETASTEIDAAQAQPDDKDSSLSLLPPNMDAMEILLVREHGLDHSPDSSFHSPLIYVWRNVCASVAALETGLTAARCVQTTVVVSEFASNVMSLTEFGLDVSQKGLLYGLQILFEEFFVLHMSQQQENSAQQNDKNAARSNNDKNRSGILDHSSSRTKYTHAAVQAVKHSQVILHNAKMLATEKEQFGDLSTPLVVFAEAILGILSSVVGRGWLWGREEQEVPPNEAEATKTAVGNVMLDEEQNPNRESTISDIDPTATKQESTSSGHDDGNEAAADSSNKGSSDEVLNDTTDTMARGRSIQLTDSRLKNSLVPGDVTSCAEGTRQGKKEELCSSEAYEHGLIVEGKKNASMEMLLTKGQDSVSVVSDSPDCLSQEAALRSQHQQRHVDRSIVKPQTHNQPPEHLGCDMVAEIKIREAGAVQVENPSGESDSSQDWIPMDDVCLDQTSAADACTKHGSDKEHTTTTARAMQCDAAAAFRDATCTTAAEEAQGEIPHWVKLAGVVGLGAVGAATGLAIINSMGDKDDSSTNENDDNKLNHSQERPTPYIEELPLEPHDGTSDKWESVASS